ncbi:helix-turn-helix domain-containing protein [uncultured Halomonas sp.]|uniref:helix-turn-helix domain-containing protein n=1 Tax=uncultured Halomonas sp. TaxID=173971 RepID=UPI00260FBE20|nr:helix-turn-helix domain-containing protein [uncultured Halomonas sp.]
MAQDRVEAVERALTVLEAFDGERTTMSLAELAQATGFYKSTLLRLLGSLARFDYVRRGSDGLWQLGDSPGRLARRQAPAQRLAARVQPLLDEMARELGETASLLEQVGETVECRLASLPATPLRHDLHPGMGWPLDPSMPPCLAFAGGVMVTQPLPELPGVPRRWLALSGPTGRLNSNQASQALARATASLECRPGGADAEEVS